VSAVLSKLAIAKVVQPPHVHEIVDGVVTVIVPRFVLPLPDHEEPTGIEPSGLERPRGGSGGARSGRGVNRSVNSAARDARSASGSGGTVPGVEAGRDYPHCIFSSRAIRQAVEVYRVDDATWSVWHREIGRRQHDLEAR
jgi:hypothetical protein